jgi:hypothetical protein
MLQPAAGRLEDPVRELAVRRPPEGLAALDERRRRLAAELMRRQYQQTGPWAWRRDPNDPISEQIRLERDRARFLLGLAEQGEAETRDGPVTRDRIRAKARQARAILDQADPRRPATRRWRVPASGGADWHRPPPRSGPLTAADRAFLVYQHDQERLAATERRERMRRMVARVRRELASHHGSGWCPSTRPA